MVNSRTLAALSQFSLASHGRLLDLEICAGDSWAVMAPPNSESSLLMSILDGDDDPVRGKCVLACQSVSARPGGRRTPQSFAQECSGGDASRAVQALSALGLWDDRQTPIAKLEGWLSTAAELIPLFAGHEELMLIDGQLDECDPWTLKPLLETLLAETTQGRALVAVTSRPDLAEQFNNLLVLKGGEPIYAGRTSELLTSEGTIETIIETDDESAVRQMIGPFEVHMKQIPGGWLISTPQGQQVAANLLKNGYGSVRTVVLRQPTMAELLQSLITRR